MYLLFTGFNIFLWFSFNTCISDIRHLTVTMKENGCTYTGFLAK